MLTLNHLLRDTHTANEFRNLTMNHINTITMNHINTITMTHINTTKCAHDSRIHTDA